MLQVFEELAQITGAELTDALVEVERISCLGASFTTQPGEFEISWLIDFGWTRQQVALLIHDSDVEMGEDWLIERFTRCILDELANLRAFTLMDRIAVA